MNADRFPFLQAPDWPTCRPGCLAATFLDLHATGADGDDWPGDLIPGRELAETHDRLTECVQGMLELGLLPLGVGGGHDLTFPMVRAVAAATEGAMHGVTINGISSLERFQVHLNGKSELEDVLQ